MPDIESNRKPTRDYRALSAGPWPLWDVVYSRRSCRKYAPMSMDPELIEALEGITRVGCAARDVPAETLRVVTAEDEVERVRTGAYRGALNKINLWLARAPIAAFLVMAVPSEDVGAGRPAVLPRNVMAVEDVILWLTERGLGTCWMAGVNQSEVRKALGMEAATSVPAVIAVGRQAAAKAISYASALSQVQSKRRKTLSRIAAVETSRAPYSGGTMTGGGFSAVDTGISGLVGMLAGGGGSGCDAPRELQVEACLEAARFAPSGANAQAWRFVVVRSEPNLKSLASSCDRTAPEDGFAVVAAGSTRAIGTSLLDRPFWMIDVPIALSHMSLAAASMGCPVVVQTDGLDEAAVNRLVSLENSMRAVGVMWVG